MSATQLSLDFTPITPPPEPEQALLDTAWHDVSSIAHDAGFDCACLVSTELHEQLDDQALYDALWTACFTLSLDKVNCALFTLELAGKPMRFKILQIFHTVYLGRMEDF